MVSKCKAIAAEKKLSKTKNTEDINTVIHPIAYPKEYFNRTSKIWID